MSYKTILPATMLALLTSCQFALLEQESSTDTLPIVQASVLELKEAELKAIIAGLEDMVESCQGLDLDLVAESLRQSCMNLLTTGILLHARLEEVSRLIMDSLGTSLTDSIDATLRDLGLMSEAPVVPEPFTAEEQIQPDTVRCCKWWLDCRRITRFLSETELQTL